MIKVFQAQFADPEASLAVFFFDAAKKQQVEQLIQFVREKRITYKHVATVDGDSLEDAFRLTNTIDNSWWKNMGVKPTFDRMRSGCRSSSVGDIFVHLNHIHICCGFGFGELDAATFFPYLKEHK